MSSYQAIILGIVQGLTEFLPVSSSGHLVLFEQMLQVGFGQPVLFELVLHLGTLIAIMLVFRHDLLELLLFLFRDGWGAARAGRPLARHWLESAQGWMIILVIAASIPTAAIGLLFEDYFESLFDNPLAVSLALLLTGGLLMLSRLGRPREDTILAVPLWIGLAIGVAQGLAITPGISRSGATISVALLLGVGRATAGKFSFIVSIPAILGAFALKFQPNFELTMIDPLILGLIFAFVCGYLALRLLLRFIAQGRLHWWSWYCWAAGVLALAYFGLLSEQSRDTIAAQLQYWLE